MPHREKVNLPEIPGVWSTNLNDKDLREFYEILSKNPNHSEGFLSVRRHGIAFAIEAEFFQEMVPFRDGFCRCIGFDDRFWVTYRTKLLWELWQARQEEIEELREHQEFERNAEREIFRTENRHLSEVTQIAIDERRFDDALTLMNVRYELWLQKQKERYFGSSTQILMEEILYGFREFPSTKHGVQFLEEHSARSADFLSLAQIFLTWGVAPSIQKVFEIRRVFDAAITLHPNDAHLFKKICLFLRRHGALRNAIRYCEIAVERGLKDDTQSGFVGRLKRLQSEQKKRGPTS